MLAECYKKIKAAGKKFEVIFVSSDRDQKSFDEYYETMPWLTIGLTSDKKVGCVLRRCRVHHHEACQ